MLRAGYEMRVAGANCRCGGCGADIWEGDSYGGDTSSMEICEGCIEIFEAEDRLTPRLHNFGGAIFEETGVVRLVEIGEWYTNDDKQTPYYRSWNFESPTASPFVILRPVRVEAPQ